VAATLLDLFAFLSVLLRAMTLAFEALTVGGVIFHFAILRQEGDAGIRRRLSTLLICSAGLLVLAQLGYVAANALVLMESTGLTWAEVRGAEFCVSGSLMMLGSGLIAAFTFTRAWKIVLPIGCILILSGAVMSSHSMARLEHRWILAALTLTHHAASAAWIGGLPYLLLSLRSARDSPFAAVVTGRFSRMAIFSVAALLSAGLALSTVYVASFGALIGTAYGSMVLSKVILTALVLTIGALNKRITAAVRAGVTTGLLQLRRLGEAEVGLGLTVILAAASLTSSPPAVDIQADRVSLAQIATRMAPVWPRMQTPAVNELTPPTPLNVASKPVVPASFVPGQRASTNNPADIAWSEYNHHWAGLIVLAIGVLSLAARRMRWARNWPLVFFGLAVFLLIRADAENWPLGPHGFWESFQVAEVAQHRLFVLLIVAFAIFEWRVQMSGMFAGPSGLVFPMVCAAGGALLLTHSHSLGNVKEELLAELSHASLAIFAVMAGWSRWLELRLKPGEAGLIRRAVPWVWPVCFILIGAILLNYREA
jgi:copper resistance protein D